MKTRTIVLLAFFIVGMFSLAGCGTKVISYEPPSIYDDPSCLNSPSGSIPSGAKAYSPDHNCYACEVEPYYMGNIGVFSLQTNQLIIQFKALPPNNGNDLKGMAWSRCSQYLAIMYHAGMRPGINLYDAQTGDLVRFIGASGDHQMVFSLDNTQIITPSKVFPSGLPAFLP